METRSPDRCAAELPGFPALPEKPAWMIRQTTAIPAGAARTAAVSV